jgi:hypothetical protein
LFNILNDDAFSSPERCAGGALTQMSSVPEAKPPPRETPMSSDFKVRRLRIQELNIAKVGTGNGNGDVNNLAHGSSPASPTENMASLCSMVRASSS